MKTLLFCTSYADSNEIWENKYRTWYDFHQQSLLKADQIVFIDDCSPCAPSFLSEKDFIKLSPPLGYPQTSVYPGWYRSFSHAYHVACLGGFEKIIHVESDAYLLSDRIINFLNTVSSGWHSMWHPTNAYPESAVQVICADQFQAYRNFTSAPYEVYAHHTIEKEMPFTEIHKEFIGDRYGETNQQIPANADFSCQTSVTMLENWKHGKALL